MCKISVFAQRLTAGQQPGRNFVIAYPNRSTITRMDLREVKAENKNGVINIVYLFADGAMLQVNNISQDLLKDTSLKTASVRMVYISANQDTTLLSDRAMKVRIRCKVASVGSPLSVYVLGRVSNKTRANTFETQFYGTVPSAEMLRQTDIIIDRETN